MVSTLVKLAVCVFYGLASSSLSFLNKSLFLNHNYKYPNMILLLQFVYGIIFTVVFKIVKPGGIPRIWQVPDLSLSNIRACWTVSCTFLINVLAGITAISRVNIPVFLAIRRLTTLSIFMGNVFYYKQKPKMVETIGVLLISIGALLAALNDLNADMVGYGLIILNNFATTLHFNRIKTVSAENPGLSVETISFFMSSLSIPVLIFLAQFDDKEAFELFDRTNAFYFLLVLSLMSGITLTFSQNLCTVVNSPITTSITGNVKDIGLTFVSFLIFTDVIATPWLIFGLILSLAGAFIYSYPQIEASYKESKKSS